MMALLWEHAEVLFPEILPNRYLIQNPCHTAVLITVEISSNPAIMFGLGIKLIFLDYLILLFFINVSGPEFQDHVQIILLNIIL